MACYKYFLVISCVLVQQSIARSSHRHTYQRSDNIGDANEECRKTAALISSYLPACKSTCATEDRTAWPIAWMNFVWCRPRIIREQNAELEGAGMAAMAAGRYIVPCDPNGVPEIEQDEVDLIVQGSRNERTKNVGEGKVVKNSIN
ncbi:hypothetical protein DdX_17028 [Ditylenchus destructor]|uniref:Secreted protein n=1 Tax=Ditylenchus destructor TaxID=166010 RepID=A0AAD4QZI6_9BILA|nr:hypothetical protein DdX_17028 [Ditylenchus destructor]